MISTSSRLKIASMVIDEHIARSAQAMVRLHGDARTPELLSRITSLVLDCFSSGGKLLICGNGGSAADAQHIAAEFVGRYKLNRTGLPALALTTDTSALTAIGNDFSFQAVFSRQIIALGKPGDLLWAISTSGRSTNIVLAMQAARHVGMKIVGFTGAHATEFISVADAAFAPAEKDTAVLQQLHMVGAHAICDAVEQELCQ